MDINQSVLSNYPLKDQPSGRSSTSVKNTYETSRSQELSSSQSAKQLGLKEGQIIKGQITDIRYNEVKIQLDPGKQVVTARLSGEVPLTIGQNAEFQVTEEASDHLVLKYLPTNVTDPNAATVQKALTASGLPNTERNQILVTELLNHRMPIDKLTLQSMSKLALINREASPLTLVLMQKNHIPITPGNVRQFEAYQKGTHQLLNDIKTISQNIAAIVKQDTNNPANHELSPNLLLKDGIASPASYAMNTGAPLNDAVVLNSKLIQILYGNSADSLMTGTPLRQSTETAWSAALDAVTDMVQDTISNTVSGSNLSIAQTTAQNTVSNSTPGAGSTPPDITQPVLPAPEELMSSQSGSAVPATGHSTDLVQPSSILLSHVMSPADRTNLLQYLSSLPDTGGWKEAIAQGNVNVKEALTLLRDLLPQMSNTSAAQLLQSKEYSGLLNEAFLQKWTLTPEKVAQKASVADLFGQLQEDMEQLSILTATGKELSETKTLQEPMKNVQENIHFMKDLNDIYTYLQLPVQFKDQLTHADLYVMTRKKALSDKRENLSVLLHLEMLHLGAVNVHIQMKSGNQIQTDFYIEDKTAASLIQDNLPSLTAALEEKGYTLKADVRNTYEKPDFAKDFIEQDTPDTNLKRYTFDIRT